MRIPNRIAVAASLSLLGLLSTCLIGCGGNNAPAGPTAPTARNLFEYDYGTNTVDEFSFSATGTPVATAALALPSTFEFSSLTQDPTGKVYLAGFSHITNNNQVLVYAAGATSFTTPLSTINANFLSQLDYVAADSSGDVYLCGNSVTCYEYNAAGSVIRTLSQPNFGSYLGPIAVDTAGNFYISGYNGTTNLNEIDVVPTSAPSGNITPSHTLTLPATNFPEALTVDSTGNLYVSIQIYPYTAAATSIEVFTATGTTPTRTITLPTQTAGFTQEISNNVSVDSAGYIYTLVENFNPGFATVTNPFYGFAPGATTPFITINLPGEPYGSFFVQ